jgi:hypothetical protein
MKPKNYALIVLEVWLYITLYHIHPLAPIAYFLYDLTVYIRKQ